MTKTRQRILWPALLIALLVLTAFTFAASSKLRRSVTTGIPFPAAKHSTSMADRSTRSGVVGTNSEAAIKSDVKTHKVEAEIITVLSTGFEPNQITRPAGPFILAVENRSGVKQVDFQLDIETGARVFQVTRSWELSDWNQVINPGPGRYVLTEKNHPAWRCVITITTK